MHLYWFVPQTVQNPPDQSFRSWLGLTLVVLATHTFPGNVGSDGFTLSNRYNQVIEGTRRDRGFGWQVAADLVGDRLHVKLRDATGAP